MNKPVDQDLITCSEAAGILGISLQAVHHGLRKGIVRHQLINGRKMIDPHRGWWSGGRALALRSR